MVAVAHRAGPDGGHVGAAARLGHRDGGEGLPAADRGEVLLLEGLAARPVEVRRGHVGVHAHRHGERARARARHLLVEHRGGEEVGAGAAVLLVVLHAEEAELAHARPDATSGSRPPSSHSSTCGATSLSTKDRTACRNISCCSSKTFTPPPLGPLGLDRVAVHRALGGARQRVGERHHVRPLEAGDLRRPRSRVTCWAVWPPGASTSTTALIASPQRASGMP